MGSVLYMWASIKFLPAQLLFCSLNLSFGDVLVAVAVVICLSSPVVLIPVNAFKSTLSQINLKAEFSLWKRIKCLPASTPRHWEKSENGGFTRQMYFVRTKFEIFVNLIIAGHFVFVLEENSSREITWLSWRDRLFKVSFPNFFRAHDNDKPTISNSSSLSNDTRNN